MPRSPQTTRPRSRPYALAPGASAFAGAWVVGVAIARLTGAAAVVLVLAAAVAGLLCAALQGRRYARSFGEFAVVGPTVITSGEPTELSVTVTTRSLPRSPWRIALATGVAGRGSGLLGELEGPTATRTAMNDTPDTIHLRVAVVFPTPGVFDMLTVSIETAGASGLVWWRRATSLTIEPIYVAPAPVGPVLAFERSHSGQPGATAVRRGSPSGEVDGVRTWRAGEGANGIHWPSSLRAGALIVHDRNVASDTRWTVTAGDASTAARLRHTLDEGLRAGHDVELVIDGAEPQPVRTATDAARWSSIVAADLSAGGTGPDPAQPAWWRRQIALPGRHRGNPERTVEFSPLARWSTAAAAGTALTMLVGALAGGPATIGLIALGIVLGAVATNRFAGSDGGRPLALRALVGIAAVVALGLIAVESNGVGGLLAALRGPLPDLLMVLVVLHGFEVSNRRTLRVHQAITFVVAVYAAGLRIDDRLGWWLAAWAAIFVAAITLTTAPRGVAATPLVRWRPIVGWFAAGAAITLAILVTVPVPDGPASLGLPALSTGAPAASPGSLVTPDGTPAASTPSDGTRGSLGQVGGYPGFSETLDTSVRGGLTDDVVMRVRSPEPAFWRGQTFTEFDGRTWSVSPDLGRARTGPNIELLPTIGDVVDSDVVSEELIQTYFIEADLPNVVFAAQRAETVIFDGTIWARPDGALRSNVTLTEGSVYTVVSERLRVTPDILRAQGDVSATFASFTDANARAVLDPFIALPESTTDRTVELATKLRTPGESTYDTVLAYQAWIAANTQYDLDAPIPDERTDAVDDFLFETRLGFCEQIASTLTIMLRSQGVPARLATGYLPGERDRVSGVWKVRASDAHSWVEVWFPETGWEPFDPTADVPLAGEANIGTVGADLISAAISSIVSHPLELGALMLLGLTGGTLVRTLSNVRQRRQRGRWGLLQDRFTALGVAGIETGSTETGSTETGSTETRTGDAAPPTNPHLADLLVRRLDFVDDDDIAQAIRRVATELDRAVFDPSWTDTDDAYHRTDHDLTSVERLDRSDRSARSTLVGANR
jgi:protein-glutamine gamma-glutamyltransferase